MKRATLIFAVLAGLALLTASCDSGPTDDLLVEYRSHAIDARDGATALSSQYTTPADLVSFHVATYEHLFALEQLRSRMADNCAYSSRCEQGGGATGKMDHGCMHGGYYLTAYQMKTLEEFEDEVRDMMNGAADLCGEDPAGEEECIKAHGTESGETLGDLVEACSSAMSGAGDNTSSHREMCGAHMSSSADQDPQ